METIKNKEETKEKILSVLKKGTVSEKNFSYIDNCFMLQDNNKCFFIESSENPLLERLPLGLNRNLILMYSIFPDCNKEIYLGDWVIQSLFEALKHYEEYCKNNQKNIFNIGYRYIGLGNVEVISCDLTTHLLFFRRDGGSNGYERFENNKKVINDGSADYPQFLFSDWFYNIKF